VIRANFSGALFVSVIAHALLFFVPHQGVDHPLLEVPPSKLLVQVKMPEAAKPKLKSPLKVKPKAVEKKIPLVKTKAPVKSAQVVLKSKAATAEELLADPVKGKFFSQYFKTIKARIQTVADRHRKFVTREKGQVELDFILSRKGSVVSLQAFPNSTASQNPLLISRATDIIRESEPFLRFPDEIEAGYISFNITLVFDG
jgi:hypothetical protein